ncbi:14983_t:CDS:2, partial [Acaulospora morrowiae]
HIARHSSINCAEAYAKARQEVLSIPGTSVIEDIQYAMYLLYEQYKAETWPEKFKPKYDLSLAESPTKEALVAARKLEEFSNLTTVLHQELNYDFYWAVNETSRILSKAIGEEYDDLEECDNSMEGLYKKSHVYQL